MTVDANKASRPRTRYAIFRDLDHPTLKPCGVLFEEEEKGARLHTFDGAPWDFGLKSGYDDYDDALTLLARSFLCTATGREG